MSYQINIRVDAIFGEKNLVCSPRLVVLPRLDVSEYFAMWEFFLAYCVWGVVTGAVQLYLFR